MSALPGGATSRQLQLLSMIWLGWVGSSGPLAVYAHVGCWANVSNSSAHIRVQVGLETYARHSPLYGDGGRAVTRI